VHLLVSIAKLAVILVIVYAYLRGKLDVCLSLRHATPDGALAEMARLVFGVVARIAVALLAIAALELLFQRWKYKHDLRMTRQEVLEERRRHEISPQLRSRIRTVQIEMARKRMLQEVPSADVVVTNPTHVAVALRYDAGEMDAPQVIAKGGDFLCEKIKEIARANDVPIVQRPALARTLYETVELGESIPETLFVAVAEVLAMIYRLRRKRQAANPDRNG
jgi:flagellar biosynthetic protein FlhB